MEEVIRKKRRINELKKQILQQQEIAILSQSPPVESSLTKISRRTKKSIITEKPFFHLSIWFKRNQKNKISKI